MQEMPVPSLGQEDSLEKDIATHANILAWGIAWTEELGGLQSMGSQRFPVRGAGLDLKGWIGVQWPQEERREEFGVAAA